MKLNLLFFGILTDATGKAKQEFESDATDVDSLNKQLQIIYPELIKHTYKIGVNSEIVSRGKKLYDGDEVSFLPPFAGG
ncbi:MAG: hypothetical protein JWN78_2444 [Bacteroidota bacterium]|nr:hypothetical protein [Bacteroidota bacterium]